MDVSFLFCLALASIFRSVGNRIQCICLAAQNDYIAFSMPFSANQMLKMSFSV